MRFYLTIAGMVLCGITLVFAAPGTITKTVSEPTFKAYTSTGRVVSFNGRKGTVTPISSDYADSYPTKGTSWSFQSISTNSLWIRQGETAQTLELAVGEAAGAKSITLAPFDSISSSQHIRVGTHGLYVNDVKVLSW